jgi:hypothetical protein
MSNNKTSGSIIGVVLGSTLGVVLGSSFLFVKFGINDKKFITIICIVIKSKIV